MRRGLAIGTNIGVDQCRSAPGTAGEQWVKSRMAGASAGQPSNNPLIEPPWPDQEWNPPGVSTMARPLLLTAHIRF
jgi:hypothetical protein